MYLNFCGRNRFLSEDKTLRHLTRKSTQIQFYLQEMSMSTFVFIRAWIQSILGSLLSHSSSSRFIRAVLVLKPAFSPKLITISLSDLCQAFLQPSQVVTFSFSLAILSMTMFDLCHGARSTW